MGPWSTGISVLIRRDTKELAPFPTLRKKKKRERKKGRRKGRRESKGNSEEKKEEKETRTKERKSPEDTARRLTPARQE